MFGHPTKPRRRRSGFLRLECLEERATPSVYTPTQVKGAYGFTQVAQVNGTTLTGAGQTIAIVDAYYDPYAASDLATFDSDFGLPAPPSFQQVSQTGGSPSSMSQDSGWGGETALDIEWAHAIAPGANILLVEANVSQNANNLFTAVAYAASQPNVSVVSMSWGFSEFSNEISSTYKADLSTPTSPAGHPNVSFVASSGDTGAGAIFPSISPNVLSVGGTTLTLSGNTYVSESAWSGSGGGPSTYFSKPSYQTAYSGTQRANPDVAYLANPGTGVYVYNTYDGGLEQVGGTSAGAPQWAGLVALADQGREINGLGTLDGGSQLLPAIYAMPASNFNDITSGSNGFPATTGYDLVTGLGSPKAQLVVGSLVAYGAPTTSAPVITLQPVSQAVALGQTATFTAAASGAPAPTVQWQISTDGGLSFTNIPDATSTSYTTPAVDSTVSGDEYRAFFSNGIGNPAITNAATLSINAPPSVIAQPASQSVTVGQTATFTVAASGEPTPTIQWQVSMGGGPFFNINGATGDTFSLTPNLNQNGWQYRAVFTNTGGSVPTNAATLTVVAPATIASVQVSDGSSQRSEVRSITVTFSGAVNFAGGNTNAAAAFQLQHLADGNNVALSAAVSTNGSGQTVVTLTFAGAETDPVSGDNGGQLSLADGRYSLTIAGASVLDANGAALDGDGDGVIGGNYVSPTDAQGGGTGQLQLFRLFGDTNGDGVVDQLDLAQFRSANNSSSTDSTYLAYLDADNSGTIDQIDLGQFRQRNNASVFAT